MKFILSLVSILLCCSIFAQQKTSAEFQKELDAQYSSEERSPLLPKDRKKFKGLPFFKINTDFIVTAQLERTTDVKPFKMKTTTDRKPEYVVYAVATFEINGGSFQLNIYKSYGSSKPEYEDYLFLPFTDETSGDDSYGGGRFIDLRIPEGNEIIIDFNQAYNPYCAYNHGYSCPIPPSENHLTTRIEAGVKYKSKH